MKFAMKYALAFGLLLCQLALASNPFLDDIFTNTNETRRPAQGSEFEAALGLRGCAGFLIAPDVGGSAAHCQQHGALKSGVALREGSPADGRIRRTLEIGDLGAGEADYWLFEIQWNNGDVPDGVRFVPLIQTESNQLKIGPNETADRIFTLGFPMDISQGRLIFSWGFAKTDGSDSTIVNNISLINGNSGGGIFRESDEMLVSIVSGGPHAFGQPGWKDNDWNDPTHWNWGPAMWRVYRESATLKAIFPGGKNKYVH